MYGTLRLSFPVRYRTETLAASHATGTDPHFLLALMRVESNFDASAVSPRGAVGLMQLMPDTAHELWPEVYGKDKAAAYNEVLLFTPAVNLMLGASYIAHLKRQFGGNRVLAAAAYNGGGTNVRRWIKGHTWKGEAAFVRSITFPETRDFVLKVGVAYRIYTLLYPGLR